MVEEANVNKTKGKIEFSLKTKHVTSNHAVWVSAHFDGKNPPRANASLSGFGDSLNRDVYFNKKSLEDGMKAIEAAQSLVDQIQEVADRWYKEVS